MIRKILSPIIYAASIYLVGIIMIMIVGVHSGLPGTREWLLVVLASTPIFLVFNVAMVKLEKLASPTIYDHLRQSVFWYLAYGALLIAYATDKASRPLPGLVLSLLPIMINALYLCRRRKANIG